MNHGSKRLICVGLLHVNVMERNTAQRAADTINQLLQSHVSDEPTDINVHEAMAVRDELREIKDSDSYDMPSVGDELFDKQSNHRFGDGHVEIVEVTDTPASEYSLTDSDCRYQTVDEANPGHPKDAPVVLGKYVHGSNKEYAYPVTRLE